MNLDVYLYGVRIGALRPATGGGYSLAYDPEPLEALDPGAAVLSSSLPARAEPYSHESTSAYVEGLLPEGERRRRLAAELGIDADDGFALIAEIGRDCPGAVAFLPEDEPVLPADRDSIAWLSEEELAEAVQAPPRRHFDPEVEQRMRFALPGERHKLALHRDERNGRWAWPEPGLPSTHVVKPEAGKHPEMVANELFCSRVVEKARLRAAETAVETIGGRRCFVAKRFDRLTENGETEMFHQESFAQALGFPPGREGEGAAGPDLAAACGLLRATAEPEEAIYVLAAAFCNYLLGNGDSHGENFSLLFSQEGTLIGPWSDIASTVVYGDTMHSGLTVCLDPSRDSPLRDLEEIAEECGLDLEACQGVAGNISANVSGALLPVVKRAKREGWHGPVIDEIIQLTVERCVALARAAED
jgi:serine/threonine-protein kinase HipA